MILIGLSILAAIGLLVLIVWALHRNQRRENEENVDRNLPLPPLKLSEREVTEISALEDILEIPPRPSSPIGTSTPHTAAPVAVELSTEKCIANSRELLNKGEFQLALQQCHSALPQMGAFRQSCVVLRAQIRELKKQGKPHNGELLQLYQLAALADFFHGKVPHSKALPPSAVKRIDFDAWISLSCPYRELGYEKIELLTKTDIKWLVQQWGEPENHSSMHQLHQAQWNNLRDSIIGD